LAQSANEIKSGRREFTTQMQLPGAVQSAPAGQAAGGNAPMTRTACINAANPIPDEGQCKVDRVDRGGSFVTWAMTCNSPRGEIQSAGSARYAGTKIEGTETAGPGAQRSADRYSRPYLRPLSRPLRRQIAYSAGTKASAEPHLVWAVSKKQSPRATARQKKSRHRLCPLADDVRVGTGKWQLRAPKSLHRQLAERAKREGVSLNTLAVTLLAEGLGERTAQER